MKFIISRVSDPLGSQPIPEAFQEDFPITLGSVTLGRRWAVEVNEIAQLLKFVAQYKNIVLSTAPYMSGVVGQIIIIDIQTAPTLTEEDRIKLSMLLNR